MPQVAALNIAISSILALEKKLDVTANNIANVNTDEFKKNRAIFQTGDLSGISVMITKVNTPGTIQPNGLESSNVFLAEEFANLITTQHSNAANVQIIETEAEMRGYIFDVFA